MPLTGDDNELPAIAREQSKGASADQQALWTAISAFLSLKAPTTQRTYLGIIREWCLFLGAEAGTLEGARRFMNATDLSAIAYRSWLNDQQGQNPRFSKSVEKAGREITKTRKRSAKKDGYQATLSSATIKKKIATLRRVYRAVIRHSIGLTNNPFESEKIPPPSDRAGQKRPTEMINFELVNEIVNLPDRDSPKGLRDRALLAILFGGGLRRSEALALRLADVKKSRHGTPYLQLRATKSKRDFNQALPDWAAAPLADLVESRRSQGAGPADYLFVSYRGKGGEHFTRHPLSDAGLYRLFKHYCAQAGAGEHVSPHSARATAITKLLEDGWTHREVQDFSRHASVTMVEVYDKRRRDIDESPAKKLTF